mmetsp:Transcript_6743/g.13748  ORF Transcript_6743/g.13748 Transcript_6743/m.13748 type:complete len:150 (+) Transcript_6743:1256-1705(+)
MLCPSSKEHRNNNTGNNKEPWSRCSSDLRNSNDNCTSNKFSCCNDTDNFNYRSNSNRSNNNNNSSSSSNRTLNPTPTTTRSPSHNNRICFIARCKTAETNTSVDRISILVAEQRFFHDLLLYKILPLLLLLHVMYYYNPMFTRNGYLHF